MENYLESVEDFVKSLRPGKLTREEILEKLKKYGEDSITDTDLSGFERDELAQPELLDLALDEVECFDDPILRAAVKAYCEQLITEEKTCCISQVTTMSEITSIAIHFHEGYLAAQNRRDKRVLASR